jgi:hypothetical protein
MRKNGLRVKGCGFKISSVHYSPFSTRHSLSVTLPICRLHDLPISFGRANFLVSPIWVRGAECGCQAKIFGNAGALPHKTTRYSLFAIRYSPVAAIFGFNWRVVLQHDRIFSARQSRALQKNHSLLAIRYSLPFRLGRSLAFPIHSVPRPSSLAPF